MRKVNFLIFIILSLAVVPGYTQKVFHYVDPFIGTEGEGNVFPGAALPFGMVKLGPDCKGHSNSGYISGGQIEGFSHTHVSGTGGGAKYGNIMVSPQVGEINFVNESSPFSHEFASAGYYTAFLDKPKVKAELTVADKVGFHQYTFPPSTASSILIDAGHFLFFGHQWGEAQELVGSEVRVLSDTEVEGYNRVRHGWNFGDAYTVFFYAKLDKKAAKILTWKGERRYTDQWVQPDSGEKTGAAFTFETKADEQIRVKVGISFISTAKARENLESNLPHWDFEQTKNEAADRWNSLLSKIEISGSETQKKVFYTSMYHAYLMPVERNGENPKWTSGAPHYDDFYAIWDTYRTPHPLMTILTPDRQVDMINALLDIYQHEGYMPDARSGNDNGRTQGGSDADILIYDAYAKGLKGIDYELALESMIKNATVAPGDDERKEGRGGLADYNKLGYISTDYERAGSRTLEFAYCDFALANMAKALGRDDLYQKYIKGAGNWKNLWDSEYESHGVRGFIMPKRANGQWHKDLSVQHRAADGGEVELFDEFTFGYWEAFFYESNSWEYSLFVPHDVEGLMRACGGREAFVHRLDTFFNNNFFQVSNEPGFLTPYLYSWAGRQDKTAHRIREILNNNYHAHRAGIPGNDDSGSMGAWYVFNSMGFYPNAGQNVYLIGSPLFEHTTIHLPNGNSFDIEAKKLSDRNIYVQSATLNGVSLDKAWFQHENIANGGKLILFMGSKPTDWGSTSPPPSLTK
ncbi:MAG: glycoside hydrolase family 92 protein [Cyclobacteriaceae bacterium]|nr:glycoside hydrolase family 92 protein [Cyclobacteriaceae bacterium]